MNDETVKIYSGTSHIQAMGVRNVLHHANIKYYEMNKQDSAYVGLFGTIDIYVASEDKQQALALIKSFTS